MAQLQSYPNRDTLNGQMEFIVDDPTINQTVNLTFETLRDGIVTTTAVADIDTLQELLDGKLSLEGGVMSGQITFASGQTFPEDPNATMIDTTFGSELVEQGPNSIAAVTRNTTQTISGGKTFTGTVDLSNSTLIGVELGADVTTRARIYAQLGISSAGRSNFVLNEQGVFVQLPDSAGNVTQLVNEITTQQTAIPAGGGVAQFSVTGVASTIVNISIVNANPANWITDSAIASTQVILDDAGNGTVNITVPTYTLTDSTRSFQVRAQVEGAFQAAVTSEVVTQYTANNLLTSISLSAVAFGNAGVTEAINVSGVANTQYTLELFQVTPAGWIASGALSATQGVLDGNGMDSSITIMIPSAQDDTVNRSFRLRARVVGNLTNLVESASISQVHTQSTQAGNLIVAADAIYATPNIDFYPSITQGDAPFEIVLNNHPTDKTVNPLHTLNLTDLHEAFDVGNVSAFEYDNGATGNDFKWRVDREPDEVIVHIPSAAAEALYSEGASSSVVTDFANVRFNGQTSTVSFLHTDTFFLNGLARFPLSVLDGWTGYDETVNFDDDEDRYWGNSTGEIIVEKTTNFQLNVGSGEYSFTTDDTGVIPNFGNWSMLAGNIVIQNSSYFPDIGRQVTVSFGGFSQTVDVIMLGAPAVKITDSDLLTAIQNSGTENFGNYSGTSTISFVANPGAPAPPADGSTDYYLHVSDNDGDVVVAMETIIIDNMTPSGMIAQTTGASSPANGSDVAFTATFTDAESNPFNYQWQYQDPLNTFTDFSDTPHSFASDVGAGYSVSTWSGSTTLSEALGFAVTDNSLQGFLVVTGFGGDVVTASIIESNTTDSINLFSEGGAVVNPLGWFNARLYDNTYTNITGETDSVYDFTWGVGPLDEADTDNISRATSSETLSSVSGYRATALLFDGFPDSDSFFWGVTSEAVRSTVSNPVYSYLGIWADGADHSTTDPLLIVQGEIGISSGFTENANGAGASLASAITGTHFDLISGILEDVTQDGPGNVRWLGGIPDANIEIWEDYDNSGLYRCQVTAVNGDTTPVNSNAIELI